ncbi:Arc family DNA-binding protein [bacterium]|nr:MAG: Arc family DNA-binding protein [bacterium]
MKNFTLRIYEALHEALKKCAARNHRSLNGEIIYALVQYVRSEGFKVKEETEV